LNCDSATEAIHEGISHSVRHSDLRKLIRKVSFQVAQQVTTVSTLFQVFAELNRLSFGRFMSGNQGTQLFVVSVYAR
jgi:hypothetical protein